MESITRGEPPANAAFRRYWLGLLLVACASLWVQWTTVRETLPAGAGGPDAGSYVSYAYNLREFGAYSRSRTWNGKASIAVPDAISPPGYPLFLAALMDGPPDFPFMHRVIVAQAALGVLTVVFAFMLALRVAGPWVALAVGALTAISPHLIGITTSLLTESLFTCTLVLSAWLLVRAMQGGRLLQWAIAGLAIGACCLVRPTLQLLPFLALVLVALLPRWRPWLKRTAIAVGFCCLLLLPWLAYKQSLPPRADQPDLLRATLYHGSFPDLRYDDDPGTFGFAYRFDPRAKEAMSSNAGLLHVVGARMRQQPLHYMRWYLFGKPMYFLAWDNRAAGAGDAFIDRLVDSPFYHRPSFKLMHAFMHGLHWPFMLLGVATALVAFLRPRIFGGTVDLASLRLVSALALAAIVLHMIGAPYPRYGIPFRPLFYLLASTGLAVACMRLKIRGQS